MPGPSRTCPSFGPFHMPLLAELQKMFFWWRGTTKMPPLTGAPEWRTRAVPGVESGGDRSSDLGFDISKGSLGVRVFDRQPLNIAPQRSSRKCFFGRRGTTKMPPRARGSGVENEDGYWCRERWNRKVLSEAQPHVPGNAPSRRAWPGQIFSTRRPGQEPDEKKWCLACPGVPI